MQFFLEHGLSLKKEPLRDVLMSITKVAKWVPEDPPIEIMALLIKYGADTNYTDPEKFRFVLTLICLKI
jgi:hypothetical protein